MAPPTTIIFDLDGTLVHSAPDLHASANTMLGELGRAPLDLDQVTSFIGNGVPKLVERVLRASGGIPRDDGASALARFMQVYSANLAVLTRPYPGVVAQLEEIAAHGIAMGVCTNKPVQPAGELCEGLNLARFFGAITGGDSHERKKPDALPLLKTIAEIGGTPERCLYVGDSETDYLTARAANVRFALFSGGYLKQPIEEFDGALVFHDWAKAALSELQL